MKHKNRPRAVVAVVRVTPELVSDEAAYTASVRELFARSVEARGGKDPELLRVQLVDNEEYSRRLGFEWDPALMPCILMGRARPRGGRRMAAAS